MSWKTKSPIYIMKRRNKNIEKPHQKRYNNKNRTLVLIEDWHVVDTHSRFWNQIREMNNDIYFKMIDDPDIKLTNFGEYIYNNIIYFAPSYNDISRKNEISITNLLQFIDDGHDLMIFGNEESGAFIRKLVNLVLILMILIQRLKIQFIYIKIKTI